MRNMKRPDRMALDISNEGFATFQIFKFSFYCSKFIQNKFLCHKSEKTKDTHAVSMQFKSNEVFRTHSKVKYRAFCENN